MYGTCEKSYKKEIVHEDRPQLRELSVILYKRVKIVSKRDYKERAILKIPASKPHTKRGKKRK